jgi:hypothetical protein
LINDSGYIANEEMAKLFKFCPNVEHLEITGSAVELKYLTRTDATAAECSLSNWKRLRSIILQMKYLHDDVLELIEAPSLTNMVWRICIQEQLTVSKPVGFLSF